MIKVLLAIGLLTPLSLSALVVPHPKLPPHAQQVQWLYPTANDSDRGRKPAGAGTQIEETFNWHGWDSPSCKKYLREEYLSKKKWYKFFSFQEFVDKFDRTARNLGYQPKDF